MAEPMPTLIRNRISSQLTQILRVYVLLVTALVLVVALAGAFFYEKTQLDNEHGLIQTRLAAELSNASSDLQSLATAPVLYTGLTDSYGREAYLEPLMARFNRNKSRQMLVLDYRGRVFLAPSSFAPGQAQAIADNRAVRSAVEIGQDGFTIHTRPNGQIEMYLVHRVLSPLSQTPVGFIVAVLDVSRAVDSLGLERDLRYAVSLGKLRLVPNPQGAWMLSTQSTAKIEGHDGRDGEMLLNVWAGRPLSGIFLVVAMVMAVTGGLGLVTLRRVRAWAGRFSGNITDRLDRLVVDSQRILGGEQLDASEDVPSAAEEDELSDVTRALKAMLRRQQEYVDELRTTSLVFSTAAEGILVTDPDGRIVEVNPALLSMTGYERDELLGRQAGTLYNSPSDESNSRDITSKLEREGRWSGESNFLARSGRIIPASLSISRIRDEHGVTTGHVSVITDVTRLKEAENRLLDLAYRDALTGLPNFRSLSEQARARIAAAHAQPRPRPMAVLFIDLDRLKSVNDNYSHDIGDEMIRAVSAALTQVLPSGHLLCRRSGDEFLVLVDVPDEEAFDALKQRLNELNPIEVDTQAGRLAVTVTMGACRFPQDAADWASLQICADVALNEAKQRRRGSIAWYDGAMGSRLYRHRRIQTHLAHAIEEGQIQVHYQPEVDLRTGQVIGFEALARWNDPELGLVHPTEFIPVAEDAHLIEPLTLWVTETVLRDKPALQARFPGAVVAFNAAPQAFRDQRLLRLLSSRKEQDETCLQGLEIELTESKVATSDTLLFTQIEAVVGLGLQLVIDDFGTGYSSLSRLTQFPIRRLKIDRSFVTGLDQAPQRRIARLVISLAGSMGMQVTAEGVESDAQRQTLIEMGCLRGQGWLFARALPLAQVLELPNRLGQDVRPEAVA